MSGLSICFPVHVSGLSICLPVHVSGLATCLPTRSVHLSSSVSSCPSVPSVRQPSLSYPQCATCTNKYAICAFASPKCMLRILLVTFCTILLVQQWVLSRTVQQWVISRIVHVGTFLVRWGSMCLACPVVFLTGLSICPPVSVSSCPRILSVCKPLCLSSHLSAGLNELIV